MPPMMKTTPVTTSARPEKMAMTAPITPLTIDTADEMIATNRAMNVSSILSRNAAAVPPAFSNCCRK